MPATDWTAFRAAFPALADRTYLNTAGGAPLSRRAAAAGSLYYEETLSAGDGPWPDWLARTDHVRGQVARLLNADADDIAFLSNASVAINAVAGYVDPSESIVTVADEFPSVTLPWINRGHAVIAAPISEDGTAALEDIAAAVTSKTGAIVISHVQYMTGRRYDLGALADIAESAGALLIVDATQSMGAIPIDVRRDRVSILIASGYKWLCSGYGIGAVYLAPHLRQRKPPVFGWRSAENPYGLDPVNLLASSTARQLEMGHPPFAPIFTLGGALDHLQTVGIEAVWRRIETLEAHLRAVLRDHALSPPVGAPGESGIVGFACENAVALKEALALEGIFVTARGPNMRFSVHAYTTQAEIEHGVRRLAALRHDVDA